MAATLASLGTALPPHAVAQDELAELALRLGGPQARERFANARIARRHLAQPLPWYLEPHGHAQRNEAYLRSGLPLAEAAARQALQRAGVTAGALGGIVFVSTTGLATPSLDARLANLLGAPRDVVRLPLWGLGCAGGVAGLARAAELAQARPGRPVLLVALELCTLAFEPPAAGAGGWSPKDAVAAALFGDACAAAVVTAGPGQLGPQVCASASHLFPSSEGVMGWDVRDHRLEVVLSPAIPELVRTGLAGAVQPFLDRHLAGARPDRWVLHPGGARVLEALREALRLAPEDVADAEAVLRDIGNVSSPTVLFVLERALRRGLRGGQTALLAALGPGFAAELALLRQP